MGYIINFSRRSVAIDVTGGQGLILRTGQVTAHQHSRSCLATYVA